MRRTALIVITTDRGLAGSLNANATRSVLRWVTQRASRSNGDGPVEIAAITVGRKGRDALRRAGIPIAAHFPQLGRPAARTRDVTPIARLVTEDFLAENVRRGRTSPTARSSTTLVPAAGRSTRSSPSSSPRWSDETERTNDEYLFEPSPEAVLSRLLPHYVAIGIYRAVLENNASRAVGAHDRHAQRDRQRERAHR